MGQPGQIQPWKMNNAVTAHRARFAEAGAPTEPPKLRANFYPEGAMMFNGGQSTGDGGFQVIYDTEKPKKTAEVCQVNDGIINIY